MFFERFRILKNHILHSIRTFFSGTASLHLRFLNMHFTRGLNIEISFAQSKSIINRSSNNTREQKSTQRELSEFTQKGDSDRTVHRMSRGSIPRNDHQIPFFNFTLHPDDGIRSHGIRIYNFRH